MKLILIIIMRQTKKLLFFIFRGGVRLNFMFQDSIKVRIKIDFLNFDFIQYINHNFMRYKLVSIHNIFTLGYKYNMC